MIAIAVGREGETPGRAPRTGEQQKVKMMFTIDDCLWLVLCMDPEKAEHFAGQVMSEAAAAKGQLIVPAVSIPPAGSKPI
jgi:hypothetical protein